MSHQLGKVVSLILNRYYGDVVQKVGDDLFVNGCKPISQIVKTTGLPRNLVIDSLKTLLKFDLASFEPSSNEVTAEYRILPDNVLLLNRYPRYLLQIKSKYGSEAELIIEEFLQHGANTATCVLVNIAKKYKDDKEKNITVVSLKDMFISLATATYIQQSPVAELKEGSEVPILVPVATIVPDLDARTLVLAMNEPNGCDSDKIYWKVNFDRFHQDFRDEIMINAMTRRIDENAGELMRQLIVQMYLGTAPWAPVSNPVAAIDLKDLCKRSSKDHPLLSVYAEHYLKVLEENGAGFVGKYGDAAGGQFTVRMEQASREVLHDLLEHVVNEKHGSKAARIFRLIKSRKYIEEEDIQKNAMLPNKECKALTYRLMEDHFISLQPMRKAASSIGVAKAVYLYYIKLSEVAHSVQQICYRSLHHICSRAAIVRGTHARLLDKQRRVRSIVHGMLVRQEPQQNIDDIEDTITPPERALLQTVEKQLKQLSAAEIELDKTLFILEWYFKYKK